MNELQVLEYKEQRILTTQQLAELYGTDINNIQQNFKRNKKRFIEGTHFHMLKGADLKTFKDLLTDSQEVNKRTPQLILWTERGANLHSKILDTDKAWEQFAIIEETYFNVKHQITQQPQQAPALPTTEMEIMELMFRALKKTNVEVDVLGDRIDDIKETQTMTWRDLMMKRIKDQCAITGQRTSSLLGVIYKELEKRSGRHLAKTLTQRKNRLKSQGMSYKDVEKYCKIDIISDDRPLRKIFETILEERSIQ